MIVDKFLFFCLSQQDQDFLNQYASGQGRASLFHDIPMEHLDRVRALMKRLKLRTETIYRGPRGRFRDQSRTWKQDANRFAVYIRHN